MTIVQLAVHDALNAIEPRYTNYEYAGSAPGASPAAATHDTLVQLLPQAAATIDDAYTAKLASITAGPVRDAGIATGQAAAEAVLSRRSGDDLDLAISKPYSPGMAASGRYQLTPPLNFAIGGGIGELELFAIGNVDSWRSSPPNKTCGEAYTADYEQVKALGSAASIYRTAHQTETALWEPLCETPPFPEYNSTHAATGAAAAGVLSRLLGDSHTFSIESKSLPGISRSYRRFSKAAYEEGMSLIYCGIHFRNAMETGFAQGDAIAATVITQLEPLDGL